jgi:hypothetical protein
MRGAALGTFSFAVAGKEVVLTPTEARAQNASFRALKDEEVQTLEAIGEVLLPGARDGGIAHFVDHQVSVNPDDCLLMARIANVKPPFVNIYRAALAGLDKACTSTFGKRFVELSAPDQRKAVDALRQAKLESWSGPPQPFVYFLLRQDAVDVVYGTVEGFQKLGIPYMPHILPEQRW